MTDKEIIKALECCITNKCDECAIYKECHNENGKGRVQVVLDLIKRQKAENEKLQKAIKVQDIMIEQQDYKLKTAKSEAIKKFSERLKAVSHPYADTQMVFELQIDNLVKEMTE